MVDAGGDRPKQERRFQRIDDTLLVSYSIGEDFAPEFTETYDIALGGMAILTNAPLPPGSAIRVTLELRGDEHPQLALDAIVRWSHFDPLLQRHRTGVAFAELDNAARDHLQRYVETLQLLRDTGVV